MIDILALIVTIISILIIPMIGHSFKQNSRITILESEVKFLKEYKSDISKLFQKIDDLKDEIHNKSNKYVSIDSCINNCKK